VLARDSIIYFIIVIVCLIVTVLERAPRDVIILNFQVTSQNLVCVSMGRLTMNLRGIIFDDPEHTVHLQTLQFAAGPGSEDENLG